MANTAQEPIGDHQSEEQGETRRDFLMLAGTATGAVGAAAVGWSFIDYLNPSADVLALATIEVDLSPIEVGQSVTVKWRGKPVFIRHRTKEEISIAQADDSVVLPHPQKDSDRVQKAEWLVLVGVCTHLGCVPGGQKAGESRGDFKGWFCPCHGSHYDTSGRIRKGPAPENLVVPEYQFLEDKLLKVG